MPVVANLETFFVDETVCGHVQADPEKEIIFYSIDEFILWLFRRQCVVCRKRGVAVHHIVPRSHGDESRDWHNLVYICAECHTAIHDAGVSEKNIADLQEKRKLYLTSIDREGFV